MTLNSIRSRKEETFGLRWDVAWIVGKVQEGWRRKLDDIPALFFFLNCLWEKSDKGWGKMKKNWQLRECRNTKIWWMVVNRFMMYVPKETAGLVNKGPYGGVLSCWRRGKQRSRPKTKDWKRKRSGRKNLRQVVVVRKKMGDWEKRIRKKVTH